MAKSSFWESVVGAFGFKSGSVRNSLELWRELYGSNTSKAGASVTLDRALQVSTVLACARVISNGISQVPWRVYQETDGRRRVATDHPIHRLIYRRPNGWQTSYEFRETVMLHLAMTWNAFIFLNRVGSARRITEMVPLDPSRVTVKRAADFTLTYEVRGETGATRTFPAEAIWHIRGPSWNSWVGLDAMKAARESIGLGIALEEGQAALQANGLQTNGLLSVKDKLSPEKYKELGAWLDQYAPGGARHGKPMLLDLGADFKSMMMSGADAQTLESRKFQVEEICRGYGVLPIMIGHSGDKNATFASSEQLFLAHVVHCLMPWYERLEHSGDLNLLTDAELDAGYYTKFTPQALMRGAMNDRAEYYAKGLGSGSAKGWLTQNDVRGFEDLDRSDDPEADKLPQPPAPVAAPNSDPSAPDPAV